MSATLTPYLALLAMVICSVSADFNESIVQEWPKDTFLKLGEEGRLNCSVEADSDYISLIWLFLKGRTETIYKGNSSTRMVLDHNYKAVEPAHDIATTPATWHHAGHYICLLNREQERDYRSAVITVADKATCTSGDQIYKKEGQLFHMDCQVKWSTYIGPDTPGHWPEQKWYDESGQEIPGEFYMKEPTWNNGPRGESQVWTGVYRLNRTASVDDDGKKFTCRVSFNGSDYEDKCETSYRVKYPVTGLRLEPDYMEGDRPLEMRVGDHINCTARGSPRPTYTWLEVKSNGPVIAVGSQLEMLEEMVGSTNVYTCVAENEVESQPYQIQRKVKFDVTGHGGQGRQVVQKKVQFARSFLTHLGPP